MTLSSPPGVFDAAAGAYDASFESLPGARRLRTSIHAVLFRYFLPGQTILELNAGTGTDAIALAARGVRVHATDGSPAMLRRMEQKVAAANLGALVSTEVMDLRAIVPPSGSRFDGILSDLGGLNCISDTAAFLSAIAGCLRSGGHAILCFMPRFSVWEWAAFTLRGEREKARRRSHPGGCLAVIEGGTVRTFYHDPSAVIREAAPAFRHVATIGLNIITPPPSSAGAHRRLRMLLPLLSLLEAPIARIPPFNRTGDHVLVVLQRTP